jgi:putative alpha-1,2-mannosidase
MRRVVVAGLGDVHLVPHPRELPFPIFPSAAIELDQRYYPGARFVVAAENTSSANKHVRSATLNGGVLAMLHLAHAAITAGGEMSTRGT